MFTEFSEISLYDRTRSFTLIHSSKRYVYGCIRWNTVVLRRGFRGKRRWCYVVYGAATYGRNTAHTKRVFHGPYTVVIILFTAVSVSVNDDLRSFTIVVMVDLGSTLFSNRYRLSNNNSKKIRSVNFICCDQLISSIWRTDLVYNLLKS